MIIDCVNCLKRFDVDSLLIPEKGRLVQCVSCNHKWFFNRLNMKKSEEQKENKDLESPALYDTSKINSSDLSKEIEKPNEDLVEDSTIHENNKNKSSNLLNLIIVFIISFGGIILILDTFQIYIAKIIPNIEFLLYSLYETFNDIRLFLKDLI